jgi:hypothetical protein
MPYVLANIASSKNNVTGSGTIYEVDWDGDVYDSHGIWNSNTIVINELKFFTVNAYFKLAGMSALNSLLTIYLNTPDGNILLHSINPSGNLLSSNFDACITKCVVVNTDNQSNYYINLKLQVSNGLTDTVDILTGSTFGVQY